jgi:hypothetical protein
LDISAYNNLIEDIADITNPKESGKQNEFVSPEEFFNQ